MTFRPTDTQPAGEGGLVLTLGNGHLDINVLERIIKNTTAAIERSKEQIFAIAESAREEYRRVEAELQELRVKAAEQIQEVDRLTMADRRARHRLMQVSRDFVRYTEADIKEAYDRAAEIQSQLSVAWERERSLRQRRDDLERRLRDLKTMVQRAEDLVSQVGIALEYLSGSLSDLVSQFKGILKRRELGLALILAQEDERRRVSREMHDGPAQLLANVALRIDLCERLFDTDLNQVRKELGELKRLVRQTLREVRKVIFDLRPMSLDDLGVIPALREYLKGFEKRTRISTEVVIIGKEERFDPALEVGLFRLAQEALTNIEKHSGATQAQVNIEVTDKSVQVVIKDNGRGFDPDKVREEEDKFGLISMQERAELLGGSLQIMSVPGEGTRIRIMVPLKEGNTYATHQDSHRR